MIIRHFPLALCAFTLPTSAATPNFVAQSIDAKITIGYGLAVADMDGDSKPDILLADAKEIGWYQNPTWQKHVIARNLTTRDNVCLAAQDIDGDGKAEVAVGAQWNPGETTDETESGAVFFLKRPNEGDAHWQPVRLPHEPTVHRMRWVQKPDRRYDLVVVPLHGRGNANGAGENGVRVIAYSPPKDPTVVGDWKMRTIHNKWHVTHNFDQRDIAGGGHDVIIGGSEGILGIDAGSEPAMLPIIERSESTGPVFAGVGELRFGPHAKGGPPSICAIEPFHGSNLTLFEKSATTRQWERSVLDTTLNQGHALATGYLMPSVAREQIVVGWREPNAVREFGIRLYWQPSPNGPWEHTWIAGGNTMACEDLKVADLNGDGLQDVVASGRSTKNVVIYWNQKTP